MSSPLSITEGGGVGNENPRKTGGFYAFLLRWRLMAGRTVGRVPSRLIELSYKYGTGCDRFSYAP